MREPHDFDLIKPISARLKKRLETERVKFISRRGSDGRFYLDEVRENKCVYCRSAIPPETTRCPHCGAH